MSPVSRRPVRRSRPAQTQARSSPLERLEALLVEDDEWSNAELIRLLRRTYFADVDDLEESGRVKVPV